MKTFLFVLALSASTTGLVSTQKPAKAVKKLGPNPVFMLDSVQVAQWDLNQVDANEIAMVNMYHDEEAIELLGEKAKDGAAYIETKAFARNRFVRFFRSYSPAYDSLVSKAGSDKGFQYILNDKVQEANYEGNLALVDKELIEGLQILNAAQLKERYNVTGKSVGILVKSKRPKDLYHGRKKF